MAWSWVRVSTKTSPKLANCLGGDTSSGRVRECVTGIVTEAGGEVGDIHFEGNGRWARVRFRSDSAEVRRNVIYDLQGEEVVDLVDDDERDELRHRDP